MTTPYTIEVLTEDAPELLYVTSDGHGHVRICRIERHSWDTIDPREKALCISLLRHTLDKLTGDAP